jgi:hypothetical protein
MAKQCKKDKSEKKGEAKFVCGKCDRRAKKEEKLCKPQKIGKG